MSDDVVLHVNSLGKRFRIYANPWNRLREWASLGKRTYHKGFWAVRNVSFEVRRGEFLGIIGPNGAGKSTLLKMVTGVLHPTEGTYQTEGRVLSLIELGGGLDLALTGKENVVRSAQLLGFPDNYVQERMEQIAEFSELGEFFERPIRSYSRGMRTRLSFSLFAFLECDVLILDEVLAVGDIFFKQKCFARLDELVAQNTAIILVTHSLGIVQHYCDEVIVLHRGTKVYHGEPGQAIRTFMHLRGNRRARLVEATFEQDLDDLNLQLNSPDSEPIGQEFSWPPDDAFTQPPLANLIGAGRGRLTRVAVCNERGEPCRAFKQGERACFYYEFELKKDIGVPIGGIEITNQHNVLIHSKNSRHHDASTVQRVHRGSYVRISQSITLGLAPGEYIFNLDLLTMHPDDYANLENLSQRDMSEKTTRVCRLEQAGSLVVMPRFGERLEQLHGGLCDLPGDCQIHLVTDYRHSDKTQAMIQAEV